MASVPSKAEQPGQSAEAVLADLIPVAKIFVENQFHQLESNERVQMRQLELQKFRDEQQARILQDSIKLEKHKFNLGFGLLAFGVLVVVFFSAALMFITGDVKSGLSILSHVGAVIAGLMTGLGWKKYREHTELSRSLP